MEEFCLHGMRVVLLSLLTHLVVLQCMTHSVFSVRVGIILKIYIVLLDELLEGCISMLKPYIVFLIMSWIWSFKAHFSEVMTLSYLLLLTVVKVFLVSCYG